MPERYNFVTENIDDLDRVTTLAGLLEEFCNNIQVHRFERFGMQLADGEYKNTTTLSYFMTGQSVEVDSNLGCFELRNCLEENGIAAVFINDPTEFGSINCKA